jgi:uncharacterized protein YuzE
MKVSYDPEVHMLSITRSDAPVEESDEDKPGVIVDYDESGHVVDLETLDASKRMGSPMPVEYAITRCVGEAQNNHHFRHGVSSISPWPKWISFLVAGHYSLRNQRMWRATSSNPSAR